MSNSERYDCTLAGGGLAGLSLGILLAREGLRVLLVEKKDYPAHKVCGEYVSMESWDFLQRLGVPLATMDLPRFTRFRLSGTDGLQVTERLGLGGFGISRFALEWALVRLAREAGVDMETRCSASGYRHDAEGFILATSGGEKLSRSLCVSSGRMLPAGFERPRRESANWVGVKYHVRVPLPDDEIVLHTFPGGYCGASRIEEGKSCLCYIVDARELKRCGHSIERLEQEVLARNPNLRELMQHAERLWDKPLTVSNIGFGAKRAVHDGVFYLGDSAGSIAPLTGNGMSNALRSAHLLAKPLALALKGGSDLQQAARIYSGLWQKEIGQRLWLARQLQFLFCRPALTPWFMKSMELSGALRRAMIARTHGDVF